jgi:HK97 family phage portal protein
LSLLDRVNMVKAAFMSNPDGYIRNRAAELFKPIWSQPVRRSTSQWLDLMQKSPRTDPMHKIAADVSVTPYKLYVKNTEPKREIKQHIALDLLDNPCEDKTITKSRLFYMTEMYTLSNAGEAFWIIERNGLGVPTEIYIVPPTWVLHTPTVSIPYFRILPMGNTSYQMIYVLPEDVIWFKEHELNMPYGRGRGRAEGIGDELETDEYMAKWQKTKFFNGAIPSYIGIMPGADEPTIDRMSEKWNADVGGYNKGHKTKFINWDAKITKLSDNEQEMDYIQSRKFLRDTCLQHWSMSGELFGILENANRSTIDLAYDLYARNTLSIRLKNFDDTLNAQFFPQFDKRIYIEHDNVIPEDKEFILKQSESGLKNGGLLVDEWRIMNGKEPLPDGKGRILYTPLNMVPTNIDEDDIMSNSPALQEDGKTYHSKGMTDKQKAVVWKALDKTAVKHERQFEKACKKFFQGQQDRVTAALMKKMADGFTTKDATDDPDDLTN